jgi:hypothetical protein
MLVVIQLHVGIFVWFTLFTWITGDVDENVIGADWILVLFAGFCNESACGVFLLCQFSGLEHGSEKRGTECLSDAVIRLDAEGNADKGRSVFTSRDRREELSRNTKTANKFLEILGTCRFWEYSATSEFHLRRNSGNFCYHLAARSFRLLPKV